MKANLNFELLVNQGNNTITLVREFSAGRQLVWDCYTKSELLDQWFAPSPMTTKTKSMKFGVGGHWHYAMIDLEGNKYWGLTEYLEIIPIDYYTCIDAFSNDMREINPDLPRSKWKVMFLDKGENTVVHSLIRYESSTHLESVVNMGMEQGMKVTLEKLDALLFRLKNPCRKIRS